MSDCESLLLCQVESERKKNLKIYCQRCQTIQMTQRVGKKSHFNQTIQNGSKRGAGVCLLFLWLVVWVCLMCYCVVVVVVVLGVWGGGGGRMGGAGTYFACL